jgi:hypothetical protein
MKTVFVSERQIVKEILKSMDAALGQQFGALRADSFDHVDIGLQTVGHRDCYSQEAKEGQKTCAVDGGQWPVSKNLSSVEVNPGSQWC